MAWKKDTRRKQNRTPETLLSRSLSHTHTLSLSLSHSLSLSRALSLSHKHTHSLTHKHTHTWKKDKRRKQNRTPETLHLYERGTPVAF